MASISPQRETPSAVRLHRDRLPSPHDRRPVQDPQPHSALGTTLRPLARVVRQAEVVGDHEVAPLPPHAESDLVQLGFDLTSELILDSRRAYHFADFHSVHRRFIVIVVVGLVAIPSRTKRPSAVEQHGLLVLPVGMLVHQGVDGTLPPPRGHPQPIILLPHIFAEGVVQFLEGDEVSVAPLGDAREVHGLVRERPGLKGAVDVPAAATHPRASLLLVVGNPEHVWVGRPRVLVEGGLDRSQRGGDVHLSLAREVLAAEEHGAVVRQISLQLRDEILVGQVDPIEIDVGGHDAEAGGQGTGVVITGGLHIRWRGLLAGRLTE
mmetsp:Transcript_30823/g.65588  ORF Transcript_30823/g.65588 Transcript_30823/m.65588 type:complete len:322 (-) Transcript_30823:698-1663(-)